MTDLEPWPLAFDLHDSRPLLVLIHAFPLDRRMWRWQAEPLSDAARILTVDLPGFGESAAPPASATLDEWADELENLLDDLVGGDPVVVGGLSMGGYVALRLAELHPERLEALILADTRAGADSEEGRAARDQAIFQVRRHGTPAVVEGLLPKLLSPEASPDVVAFAREIMLEQRPEVIAAALAAMRDRPDSSHILASIRVPALVIVGDADTLTPPSEAEAMARALADSWLVKIPRAGHLANLEAPDQFNAAVAAFLQSL
jgi:3-oxoadipate enol-lactonase